MTAEAPAQIHVTVAYSPAPGHVEELTLTLDAGSTVAQAVVMAMKQMDWPGDSCGVGVWGKSAQPTRVLLDGDRVEIYRALKVDPKIARRLRFADQGAKGTGLFSKRRPGAKAGY